MAQVKLLLDSVILIDHFNGVVEATRFLSEHHSDSALSVITRAEVLTGFPQREARKATQLLDAFRTLSIDQPTADLAADLRRRHGWKLPDAFQAAVARQHGLKFVTRDTRDFAPQRHRFVLVPYSV